MIYHSTSQYDIGSKELNLGGGAAAM